ncbi:hypothetical protein DPMN_179920 [Dreissena polymorpha]|uniref:Uncharacterized protein n=1 Tax=Dreissena polymorpha TaxID=45954 RepID=A0A9D4IK02_DREPO|nr:hypothetical protein DPMN_179920 [Dreissena polymorpha]
MILYEVSSSVIEAMDRITCRHRRKWLGMPPSFFIVRLNEKAKSIDSHCPHWWSNSSKPRRYGTHPKRLPDEQIREAGYGRLHRLSQAEHSFKQRDILGFTAAGRPRIGASKPLSGAEQTRKRGAP